MKTRSTGLAFFFGPSTLNWLFPLGVGNSAKDIEREATGVNLSLSATVLSTFSSTSADPVQGIVFYPVLGHGFEFGKFQTLN